MYVTTKGGVEVYYGILVVALILLVGGSIRLIKYGLCYRRGKALSKTITNLMCNYPNREGGR